MKHLVVALVSGIIFGAGLCLSGMVNPDKVFGFLDVTGNWDPSLALVMVGALAVSGIAFRFVFKRPTPVLDDNFRVSSRNDLDFPLLAGAAIFGIGWGMSGYCPGPAVAAMGFGVAEPFIMVVSIYAGFFAHKFLIEKKAD